MTAINPDNWPGPFRLAAAREISSYPLKSVILQYKRDNNAHMRDNDVNNREAQAGNDTAKQEINVNTIDK